VECQFDQSIVGGAMARPPKPYVKNAGEHIELQLKSKFNNYSGSVTNNN